MSTLTATTRNTTTWTTSPSTATTLRTALRRTTLPNFKIIYPRVQCADVSRKYIHSLNQRDNILTQILRTEDGHHNFIIHLTRNSSDVSLQRIEPFTFPASFMQEGKDPANGPLVCSEQNTVVMQYLAESWEVIKTWLG